MVVMVDDENSEFVMVFTGNVGRWHKRSDVAKAKAERKSAWERFKTETERALKLEEWRAKRKQDAEDRALADSIPPEAYAAVRPAKVTRKRPWEV